MSLASKGARGELRYGYHVAAQLSAWSVDERGRVDATASDINAYWIDQDELALWLRVGSRWWVWRAIQLRQCDASACVVQVEGSPETKD